MHIATLVLTHSYSHSHTHTHKHMFSETTHKSPFPIKGMILLPHTKALSRFCECANRMDIIMEADS